MSELQDGGAQEATDTTAQEATTATTQADDATNAPATDAASLEAARKLRSENKSLRDRLKAFEEQAETARQAEMTELQKAQERADKAEAEAQKLAEQMRDTLTQTQIQLAAQEAGAVDVDTVIALVDRGSIAYDEATGAPTGIDEAVKALLEAKPFLKGQAAQTQVTPPATGAQPPAATGGNTNQLTAAALEAMSPAQLAELSAADISAALQRK